MKTVFDNGGYVGVYADIANLQKTFVTSGLVMHVDAGNTASYPGSGATWTDLAGNATGGQLVGSPTFNSANGGFLAFNGSSTYARFQNSTALDTQTPTVEVWVKPNDVNQAGFFFEKGALNTQYSLFLYSGALYWRIIGASDLTPAVTTVGLNTTQWHHLAATYASGTGRRIYANGALVASDSLASTVNTNNGGMSIGAYDGYNGASGRSYFLNGGLAVCRIYNRALSLAEVQQNYDFQKTRFGR